MTTNDKELLENLKKEADMFGISYNANATVTSLSKKIKAFKEAQFEGHLEIHQEPRTDKEKDKVAKMMKDARLLVRCEVTCNDPKIRVRGQIFRSVGNKFITLRKVIPLESPTHVPKLILDNLEESKYLTFIKKKVNGYETTIPKEVPTYNIRRLNPLSKEELKRIQMRQSASATIGDE